MPIRFRGPVRPRKLKSPDPIKMPVVRNDKVPRIKSDVLYYKENGELPKEESNWSSMTEYFRIPGHLASDGIDSVDVSGDVMAIISSATDTVYIFKKDANGDYQQTSTTTQTSSKNSAVDLRPDEGKVVYSAPYEAAGTGSIVTMDLDFSTGVLDEASRAVYPSATARSDSYDGQSMARIGNTFFGGGPGFYLYSNDARGGMITFRHAVDDQIAGHVEGQLKVIGIYFIDGQVASNYHLYGNYIYDEDGFFANTLATDDTRLLVLAPGDASLNTAGNSYISVFDYDDAKQTLTEIQRINNAAMPQYTGTQASIRSIAALNGKMLALLNVGGPDNNYDPLRTSIVEYSWDGSAYIQSKWTDVNLSPDWTNDTADNIVHMTMLSDTELLIPGTGISGGKIYKVT